MRSHTEALNKLRDKSRRDIVLYLVKNGPTVITNFKGMRRVMLSLENDELIIDGIVAASELSADGLALAADMLNQM